MITAQSVTARSQLNPVPGHGQCCGKCKILVRPTDHPWLWLGGPFQFWVLGGPSINNLLRPQNQLKIVKMSQSTSTFYLGTSTNGHMISVELYVLFHSDFLQNLKNSLVAKRIIDGGTLGRPVDSWVAFGDRATIFQQHCTAQSRLVVTILVTVSSRWAATVANFFLMGGVDLQYRDPCRDSPTVWCLCALFPTLP